MADMCKTMLLMVLAAAPLVTANNQAWWFRQSTHVNGKYVVGKTAVLEEVPMPPAPGDGEISIRVTATSVLPSYRGRMAPENWPKSNDYTAFTLNTIFPVELVGEVTASNSEDFSVGDMITGFYPLQQFQNILADGSDSMFGFPPNKIPTGVPPQKFLSISSIAGGMTAFYIAEYLPAGQAKAGDTVLITSAASTVGMVAGQLYKAKGCTVIGSTSTTAKADRLAKLGAFDHIIKYKEEDFETRLNEIAPEGIDLDIENVGGTQLDAAIRNMKDFGRVALCGMISDYNKPAEEQHGIRAAFDLIIKRITVQGLLVVDMVPKLGEAISKMTEMIMAGKLHSEETIVDGFEMWGDAMIMMLESKNFGRLVVKQTYKKTEL